jgi:hypothetical protein
MALQRFAKRKSRAVIFALLFAVPLSAQPFMPDPQQTAPSGVTVDPSAAPLQPPTQTKPAAQPNQAPLPQAPEPNTPKPQPSQPPTVPPPVGAAAAEQVRTAGGGASRPAGNAIAPMQQHRYRSLAIKLGAIAAAGIAIGTVAALSRATPSTPPHSASAALPPR